jgi:NAD(P)-dependent dehydrogenase (short-subunit alcohol dehydrogenase family)
MRLEGRVALVTGAARRRGIGRGIALELAREGCNVAINDISCRDEGLELVDEISAMGRRAVFYLADVSDASAVAEMLDLIERDLGPLDIACPNAGVARWVPFAEVTQQDFERIVGVNLTGSFNVAQQAARRMLGHGGRIVVTSSVHAQMPFATMSIYGATKQAIRAMVEHMAIEFAPYGINVNHVSPGYVLSALNDASPALQDEDAARAVNDSIPLGRPGEPEDVGRAVVYLCSSDADYVTGSYVRVDGGLVIGPY